MNIDRARLPRVETMTRAEVGNAGEDQAKRNHGSAAQTLMATVSRRLPPLRSAIGWLLLVRVLFFSSAVTLLLTLMQLYLDYRSDVQAIDQRMSQIDGGYRQSLGEGLWRLDARQLQLQVDGILRLPDVVYVELREATDKAAPLVVTAGVHQSSPAVRREFSIFYTGHGAEQLVGTLVVEATFALIYRRLLNTMAIIMIGQAIKTFLVSFFILFIVHRLITRHLAAIASSLRRYDLVGAAAPLRLDRRPPRSTDEFDDMVEAFNEAYARLQAVYGDLQERESKIRPLVDSNIVGIVIYDLDRHVLEANEAFLDIVGYNRDDVVSGRLSFDRLTPPEWAEDDQRRLAALTSTGTWKPSEKEFFRKDGSRVPVLLGSAIFSERQRQGIGFVVDLTQQKRAEAELAHANRVATMGQLAASIAHEVSQPIAALLTNAATAARWLDRQPPNLEKSRPLIDRIVNDGKRAADIVSRIRDFSKKEPARKTGLDVNSAILEIIALTHVEMSKRDVLLKMQLSEGLPHILADRVQLQQVILNLILNAAEAMGEVADGPREVWINTAADKDGVLVAVRDFGPGLPQANPERVFEAFYTTKANGLGMGLSICRSIVEAHGGRLWATPNEPRGAVFRMLLPAREKSPENLASPHQA